MLHYRAGASWRMLPKASIVGDVLNAHHLQRVSGHGAHKRRLHEEAVAVGRVPACGGDATRFAAVTMLSKYRCCRKDVDVDISDH